MTFPPLHHVLTLYRSILPFAFEDGEPLPTPEATEEAVNALAAWFKEEKRGNVQQLLWERVALDAMKRGADAVVASERADAFVVEWRKRFASDDAPPAINTSGEHGQA